MAESDKRPVTLEEFPVSSLAQTDALAKLLIEKGLITQQEFLQKVAEGKIADQAADQKTWSYTMNSQAHQSLTLGTILQALFPLVMLGIFVFGFSVLCSILLVKWFPLIPHDAGPFLNGGPQFTLLTLVVAIAAYLATLARLLKDRMKSINKMKAEQTLEDQKAKAENRQAATKITREDLEDLNEHQTNLSRLIPAEKFTVMFGLLVVFRICVHPFLTGPSLLASSMGVAVERIDLLDISILVLLTVSMFFFALLHAAQWLKDDRR